MAVTVVEILKRATLGQTAPYLCRADDGLIYYVKNRALPRGELVAEWLAANLAQELDLPIPVFALADVPGELVEPEMGAWLKDLGAGMAFASRKHEGVEVTWHHVQTTPGEAQRRIAAFDWWIRNMDRTLTEHGGNPNMLWEPGRDQDGPTIIDHNLAFDPHFDAANFLQTHAFARQFKEMAADFIDRETMRERLAGAMPRAKDACATIPDDWRWRDVEQTAPAGWREDDFLSVLARCLDQAHFWDFE